MAENLDIHSNDLACDALQALTEQVGACGIAYCEVLSNLKLSTPALEDLVKAAGKYHALLEQVNVAASAFVDCLGKVYMCECCLIRAGGSHRVPSTRRNI